MKGERAAAGLSVLFFGLHLALFSRWYSGDALYYALMFQDPDWTSPNFCLPQHPLWNYLGTWVYHAYRALGYEGGSLELAQLLNALVGSGALYLFYLLLRELRCPGRVSLALTAWLGTSYCFWWYASDVKMYSFVSFFLFLVARTTLRLARQERVDLRSYALLGVYGTLLIMFHVTSYYLIPPFTLALLLGRAPWREKLKGVGVLAATFTAGTLAGYYLSYLPLVAHPQAWYRGSFWEWLTSPARAAYPGLLHHWPLAERLEFFSRRFLSSVTGYRWYLPPPGPPPSWHAPLEALSRAYAPAFLTTWIVAAAWSACRVLQERRGEARFLGLWLLSSLTGFVLFSPDSDYVFVLFAPLLAWLGLVLAVLRPCRCRPALGAVVTAVALLFGLNAALRWVPARDPANNRELAKARLAARYVKPEDLLINLKDSSYYAYFIGCEVVDLYLVFQTFWNHPARTPLEEVERRILGAWADGRRVFLNGDVWTDYSFFPVPPEMGFEKQRILGFFRSFHKRRVFESPLWRLYLLLPEGRAPGAPIPGDPGRMVSFQARLVFDPPLELVPFLPDHDPPLFEAPGLVVEICAGDERITRRAVLTADGRLGCRLKLPAEPRQVRFHHPDYAEVVVPARSGVDGRVDLGTVTLRREVPRS